jgi:ABC-type uncharacterized transport system auxiliary subunit
VPDAQWADTLPKMLQMKVIQAFENAGNFSAVSRPVEGLTGDYQLLIDIRRFQISTAPAPVAEVEFAGKILDGNGRILDTRIFRATQPAAAADAPAATAALDQVFGKVATELVAWTARVVGDRVQGAGAPKGAVRNKATRG